MAKGLLKTLFVFLFTGIFLQSYSQCSCSVLTPSLITTANSYTCVFQGSSIILTVNRPLGDSTLWYKVTGSDTVKIGSGISIQVTPDSTRKYLSRNVLTCYCSGPTQSTVYSAYIGTTITRDTTTANIGSTVTLLNNNPVLCNGTSIEVNVYPVGRAASIVVNRDNASNVTSGALSSGAFIAPWKQTLTNATSTPQIVTYTFTPNIGTCLGTPQRTSVNLLASPLSSNSKCYEPVAPVEYFNAVNNQPYKHARLLLWVTKPTVAVDGRDWYRVLGHDTTYLGSGDTLSTTCDTACTFIARNKNFCACADSTHSTYYSTYTLMGTINPIDTGTKPTYVLTYAPTVCSGSQTNINVKTSLAGAYFQYYRQDTTVVSGSTSGNLYLGTTASGSLGIKLTNKTLVSQTVKFLLRLSKLSTTNFTDDRFLYVTVLPDTALSTDFCNYPINPKPWPFVGGETNTYSKGAHVPLFVDTTVLANYVDWYKVVGPDTSFAGTGYSINIVTDTTCKYLARSRNYCTCNSSFYYSQYVQVANYTVTNSYVVKWHPINYMTTVASGTAIDIVPATDSTLTILMYMWNDNGYVTGTTYSSTQPNYSALSGSFGQVLTNTTNIPQRVRYTIKSQLAGGSYGDAISGYITVLPSSVTAPSGNHCSVPARMGGSRTGAYKAVKNGLVNLDLYDPTYLNSVDAFGYTPQGEDSATWYATRRPGDTTLVGRIRPVNVIADTTMVIFGITENVCYWNDSSKHIYRSAATGMATIGVSASNSDSIFSLNNPKPQQCSGDSAGLSLTRSSYAPSLAWYRSNAAMVKGPWSGSLSGSAIQIHPKLIDSSTVPQKVYFVGYCSDGVSNTSQKITSIMVYPNCANWSNFGTAIHALKDSICAGDTATLTADTLPGYGTHYVWSSGDTTKTIHPTIAGTYTVTATNGCGCSSFAIHSVILKPGSLLMVSNDTVCAGDTAVLSVTGGVSYFWNTSATTSNISTTSSGTYTVTATNANGCKSVGSGIVTVIARPLANAGQDTSKPNNSYIVLGGNPSASGGSAPYTYTWQPKSEVSDSTSPNPFVAPAAATMYSLTVRDNRGCISRDSIYVTIGIAKDSFLIKSYPETLSSITDSLMQGDTVNVTVSYLLSGSDDYSDTLSILGSFDCDSCVIVNSLSVYVGSIDTASLFVNNPKFPVKTLFAVAKGSVIRLKYSISSSSDSCIPLNGCTANVILKWKSMGLEDSTSKLPINIRKSSTHRSRAGNSVQCPPAVAWNKTYWYWDEYSQYYRDDAAHTGEDWMYDIILAKSINRQPKGYCTAGYSSIPAMIWPDGYGNHGEYTHNPTDFDFSDNNGDNWGHENASPKMALLDANGKAIWYKTYGHVGEEFDPNFTFGQGGRFYKVIQTPDGGFIGLGSIEGFAGCLYRSLDQITNPPAALETTDVKTIVGATVARSYYIYIAKVDSNGELQWQSMYGWVPKVTGQTMPFTSSRAASGVVYGNDKIIITGHIGNYTGAPGLPSSQDNMFLAELQISDGSVTRRKLYTNNALGLNEQISHGISISLANPSSTPGLFITGFEGSYYVSGASRNPCPKTDGFVMKVKAVDFTLYPGSQIFTSSPEPNCGTTSLP